MIVLGFDTATPVTAVGLRLADGAMLERQDVPASGERPGHATRLLPLADELLAQAGIDWDSLQRIAVGVGPGTFTGLRVGVATARGLAQSLALDLLGVSSLHALAHCALQGRTGSVLAAIDARRGEVFVAGWASAGEGVAGESFAGGGVARESFAPRALAPEDIGDLLSHERPALAVGDGAVRYRPSFEDLGIEVPPDTSPLHRVSGAAICELACPRKGALDIEPSTTATVLPNYLRRPDAEIALQGAAG